MSTTQQYASIPKNGGCQITVANALRDGTGTLGTVRTAGPNGGRLDCLQIQATGTTTAGMIRLFLDDGTGTVNRLIKEIPVTPVTPSSTTPAFSVEVYWQLGITLQAGWVLKAGTHNAETFNVIPTFSGDN